MAAELQGSGDAVRVLTGGAGHGIDDERADEQFPTFLTCRRRTGQEGPAREGGGYRKTSAWPEEASPEGEVSSGGKMTMDRTRVRARPSAVLLRYAYELGCCYF